MWRQASGYHLGFGFALGSSMQPALVHLGLAAAIAVFGCSSTPEAPEANPVETTIRTNLEGQGVAIVPLDPANSACAVDPFTMDRTSFVTCAFLNPVNVPAALRLTKDPAELKPGRTILVVNAASESPAGPRRTWHAVIPVGPVSSSRALVQEPSPRNLRPAVGLLEPGPSTLLKEATAALFVVELEIYDFFFGRPAAVPSGAGRRLSSLEAEVKNLPMGGGEVRLLEEIQMSVRSKRDLEDKNAIDAFMTLEIGPASERDSCTYYAYGLCECWDWMNSRKGDDKVWVTWGSAAAITKEKDCTHEDDALVERVELAALHAAIDPDFDVSDPRSQRCSIVDVYLIKKGYNERVYPIHYSRSFTGTSIVEGKPLEYK